MMKQIFSCTVLCLTVCFCLLSACTSSDPRSIRVLYLGGQSEWGNGEYDSPKKFATEAEFQQSVEARMAAFGDLLRTYFDSVTVMRAADYRPEMSDAYDVTIFDGRPPVLEERTIIRDANGKPIDMKEARYLPDNFSAACIAIGSIGQTIGCRVGTKNDWYCLCLDADAHGMNLEHPIFKGPFKTPITLTKQPTPEDAFHYAYFQDGVLPDSVMMWRVNTKGYKTTQLYNPGMVSRPWGYTDSPDCEVISSGVCAKTIDAVALGRHANYFTWGFIGGPQDMTEEAKVVFANTVAYMAQFKGQIPLARKYNQRIATREYVKELGELSTRRSYEERLMDDSVFYADIERNLADAKAKLAAGDTSKMYVIRMYDGFQRPTRQTYADYLKRYQGTLFDQFGEDEAKYLAYYKENTPYFYGGKGMYELTIDEDAKAWGIPTNDIRLIEKAVECLEQGMEVERAQRVLDRYTLCEFTQPSEWRAWLDKYSEGMFFTESGGWFFMPDEAGAPGTDYTAIERRQKAKETATAAPSANVGEPDQQNPVLVSASILPLGDSRAEVKLDIKILAGFHIYKEVGKSDPYIPLKLDFTLPTGAKLGKAIYPTAKPFGNAGTTIYDENITVNQVIAGVSASATVTCKVSCQCCDAHVCMPPLEKVFTLELK